MSYPPQTQSPRPSARSAVLASKFGELKSVPRISRDMAHFRHQRFMLTAPASWAKRPVREILALASSCEREWLVAVDWDGRPTGFEAFVAESFQPSSFYEPITEEVLTYQEGITRVIRTYTCRWPQDTLPSYLLKAAIQLPGVYISLTLSALTPGSAFQHRVSPYLEIINSIRPLEPLRASALPPALV